jgi:hypothetical protein
LPAVVVTATLIVTVALLALEQQPALFVTAQPNTTVPLASAV